MYSVTQGTQLGDRLTVQTIATGLTKREAYAEVMRLQGGKHAPILKRDHTYYIQLVR